MKKSHGRSGRQTKKPRLGSRTLPHDGVYVRLAPSKIHGVGVFAVRDIPKGAPVFGEDDEPTTRVLAALVRRQRPEIRALYEDFCILEGEQWTCPSSFNLLTPSWYLNHSKTPNVVCDESLRFFALRRIAKGEELTVDYATYSDDPAP
jgi:SET domain-containing protein